MSPKRCLAVAALALAALSCSSTQAGIETMTDQRLSFLRGALAVAPGFRILSEDNPVSFSASGVRYSAHISVVHDSGEGRENDDEQRIQVPRSVLDTQQLRREEGDVVLFIGFFPDGRAFTAWEPDHVLSQEPDENGSVYVPGSHRRLALSEGAAVRVVKGKKVGRSTSVVTLPGSRLADYLQRWRHVHRATAPDEARRILDAPS